MVIFIGADFVVFARVLAQIQQRVAADAPHARLKVPGFVFVRHDAQATAFGERLRAGKGLITAFLRDQQGLEAKETFEGVVFLENAYA